MIHRLNDVTSGGRLLGISRVIIWVFLALFPVAATSAVHAQTQKADDPELRHLMEVYAEAVNKADPALASQVWCGSEEDSITNPAGRWQGPQQIKSFYAFMNDSYSARKLTFDDISVHTYGDFAWTEFTGDFAAKQRKDGAPVSFHAAETQIYRKSRRRWCLVHVQYSTFAPPQTSEKK